MLALGVPSLHASHARSGKQRREPPTPRFPSPVCAGTHTSVLMCAESMSDFSSVRPSSPCLRPCAQIGTLVVGEVVVNQKADQSAAREGLGAVRPSVGNAVAAAAQFKEPVTVLLGGMDLDRSAQGTARLPGVGEVNRVGLHLPCSLFVH